MARYQLIHGGMRRGAEYLEPGSFVELDEADAALALPHGVIKLAPAVLKPETLAATPAMPLPTAETPALRRQRARAATPPPGAPDPEDPQ